MIGRTLLHYRITELLGAGGMGEVYRARDQKLERDVAVKVLPAGALADDAARGRFRREALALSRLSHPHIAALHDFERDESVDCLVMELVDGPSLEEVLRAGPLAEKEVVRLGAQLAQGLEAAHQRGVVHRDLKPSNLRLTSDGLLKILDFGLAHLLRPEARAPGDATATETAPSAVAGTPPYMAPEQLLGNAPDARTDVYAAGAVLYELATGVRPFGRSSGVQLTDAILHQEPRSPREANGRVSAGLEAVILKALDKDPDLRYQTARELRVDLERLRPRKPAGSEASALEPRGDVHPGGGVPSQPRGRSATRERVAWGGLALVAAAVAAGLTWMATRRESALPPGSDASWEARPLTATGDAWNVTLSPDGKVVAYLTSEGLVTQDVQGGSPNLVFRDPLWGGGDRDYRRGRPRGEPQWLHDGTAVAFTTILDAATLGISSVPRTGGEVVPRFATSFSGGEVEASFQSLPGGAFLLARVLENREALPWIRWIEGGAEQGIDVPPDTEDLWDAVASPDGRVVAYIAEREDRTSVVGTVTRDGRQHHVIDERTTGLSKWPEMSANRQWAGHRIMRWPGGHRFYYRQASPRGVDVYAADVDPRSGRAQGEPWVVYSGLPTAASFDVSPDGRRLVYSGGVIKTQIRLYRFDTERSGEPVEEHAITRGTARHVAPRLSPDGQQMAYIRKTGRSEDIYVVGVGGGEARRVNVLYQWNQLVDLKWSPDGDRLAVFAITNRGPKLLIVSLSDSRVRELRTRPPRGTWFDWSPDGRWLAYGIRGDEAYVVHDVTTGAEREIFGDLKGEKIQAMFSPDGGALLVNNVGLAQAGLWIRSLEGGESRRISGHSLRMYPVLWSRAGMVYILSPEGMVLAVDSSGRTSREVGRIPAKPIYEGWASARIDGRFLEVACAVDEPRESDVWVLDKVEPEG